MAYYKVPTTSKVIQLLDKRGRLEKIIDLVSTLPATPNTGDRYIDLTDNYVKEWDGSAWVSYIPKEGDNLYVLNRDKYFYFDGTSWRDVTEITSLWRDDNGTLKPVSSQNVEITGSFIGDGSKLTGIKKLIEEFVAQGNVTAGDVVAFVNEKVRKGNYEVLNELESTSIEYQFSYPVESYIVVERLDDTRFVLVYTDSTASYNGKMMIGKLVGNDIVFGSEYDLGVFNMYSANICVLTPDKFVLFYSNGTIDGRARICYVSDTVVTFGNETIFYSDRIMEMSSVSLDEFNIVLAFTYSIDYIGMCKKISIVNDNFIIGNAVQFSGKAGNIGMDKIDDSSFVLCYKDYVFYNGIFRKCSILDLDVLLGNENIFATSIFGISNIFYIGNNKALIVYWYYGDYRVKLLTLDNIQLDEKQVYADKASYFSSYYLEGRFIISFQDVPLIGNPKTYYVILGFVDDDIINVGSLYVVGEGYGNYNKIILLRTYLGVLSFADDYSKGLSKICFIKKERRYNYVGISLETKLDGETTKVLIQGISDVHTALIPGQKYYATLEGNLTTEPTEDLVGIAISDTKLLLLDWQRPVTLYDEQTDEFLLSDSL